jgi:hypothetical protein
MQTVRFVYSIKQPYQSYILAPLTDLTASVFPQNYPKNPPSDHRLHFLDRLQLKLLHITRRVLVLLERQSCQKLLVRTVAHYAKDTRLLAVFSWREQEIDSFEGQTCGLGEEEVDHRDRGEVDCCKDDVRFEADVGHHWGRDLDDQECSQPLDDDGEGCAALAEVEGEEFGWVWT